MENNTIQIEITEQDENNGVLTSMQKELDSLNISFNENWCIYKVPEFMLKGHEYIYPPLRISIGPVFYKDPKLEPMQKVKWIYLNSFLRHSKNACQSLNPYIEYVRGKEEEIRRCYQQEFKLSSDEFVKMIVLDAAFLVYLFLSKIFPDEFDEPLAGNNLDTQMGNAYYDLFRLENQIPYFVVKGFFDIAFGGNICITPYTFIGATILFTYSIGMEILGKKAIKSIIEGKKITDETNIEHLLDLRRMCCCLSLSTPLRNQPNTNPTTDSDSYIHKLLSLIYPSSLCNRLCKRHLKTGTNGYHSTGRLCYTAKQLFDAGVTFVAGETDNPLDVTFANGILTISKLIIHDYTESHLRNLVYFEQCHYHQDTYFIDYIIFLDQLIDTVEDVQVLVKNKIFYNHLGSDEDVVNLFNNIGKNVIASYKVYSNVSDDLYHYASKRHLKAETSYYSIRHLCYTAKQLKDAGVTFVAGETDNPLDITFDNGKLTISKLKIQDSTESHLRNLVYFEQCHYYRDSYFIDYIFFLDQLIDTVEDVQVLVKNRIFSNHLGSDDDVVKLFNNIRKNVLVSYDEVYSNVSNALNCYASKRRNRWMAILRSKYFNHPWTILSVIAAFMLFVLTLLQTIAAYIYK